VVTSTHIDKCRRFVTYQALAAVFLLAGCQPYNDDILPEKAKAAHASAVARSAIGVIPWECDYPLQGEAVEDATPPRGDEPFIGGPEIECEEAANAPAEIPLDRVRWWGWNEKNIGLARKAGKPILLHITQDNCGPCLRLDKEVFVAEKVIRTINRDFTPFRINVSRNTSVVKPWNIKSAPVDILVDPVTLKEIYRETGAIFPAADYLSRMSLFQKRYTERKQVVGTSYPIRRGFWTGCSSWRHMADASAHRGKFDRVWLKQLSWGELQSLHSDDHENRVKWANTVRPNTFAVAIL
jgi:hypothetical protein